MVMLTGPGELVERRRLVDRWRGSVGAGGEVGGDADDLEPRPPFDDDSVPTKG
jgi:hypothetical protein